VAGFATWLAYFVGALWERFIRRKPESVQAIRWLLLSGGASLAVTLLNPAGVDIWATSLGYVSNRYLVSHTNEYLPPDLLQINYWPFALLLALAIILLMAKRLRMPAAHIFLMLGWAIMGLFSARNVPIFALVSAPILASGYSGLIGQYSSKFAQFDQRLAALDRLKRLFSWPVLVLALVLMLLVRGVPLDANQVGNRYLPEHFPVAAVDAIAGEIPAGHVFNYFPWGGYLLFRLYPDVQVFIDGQTDFYGETLTRQYEQVISLTPGWEAALAKSQVEWVMRPTGEPLGAALESAPGWQVRYRDQTTTILIHE
jgi:hypothetical protein